MNMNNYEGIVICPSGNLSLSASLIYLEASIFGGYMVVFKDRTETTYTETCTSNIQCIPELKPEEILPPEKPVYERVKSNVNMKPINNDKRFRIEHLTQMRVKR